MNNILEVAHSIETLSDRYPIYRDADISLKRFNVEDVRPIAKYVLLPSVRRIQSMYEYMNSRGFDLLALCAVMDYRGHVLSPPVVEYSPDDDCDVVVDGIHRFYFASQIDKPVTALYVRNITKDRPVIGAPIPWSEVVPFEELPQKAEQRRLLRTGIENNSDTIKRYYRDYSVLGSTGRRPIAGQNG